MNPFANRISQTHSWVVPVSIMSLVLGLMIGVARVTGREVSRSRITWADPQQQARLATGTGTEVVDQNERVKELQFEVNNLREEKTRLENLLSKRSDAAKELNDSLQQAKVFAGLTELQGPGVVVVLQDSRRSLDPAMSILTQDQIIHDRDVLRVVNELYASGAEAISINNFRLGPTSSIRCVGPVVHIDGVKVASPIRVRAIGDPETLMGALNMPGGVFAELRETDPEMVSIEAVKMMKLPAYSGSTARQVATVPKAER